MIQRWDWVILDLAEIGQILQHTLWEETEEMIKCTYTGGGGWREGWSLEAGSHSLGSAPGCRPAPGKAEKALGNCMALRKGLGGAGASLSGISGAQMILITVSLESLCSAGDCLPGWDLATGTCSVHQHKVSTPTLSRCFVQKSLDNSALGLYSTCISILVTRCQPHMRWLPGPV